MILHIVHFRPKRGVSEADRAAMFDALGVASRAIPSIRSFVVGNRITHGAAYEQMMTSDFPFVAVIGFDDLAGLQAYRKHPTHDRLSALFYELQEAALVFDYEVATL